MNKLVKPPGKFAWETFILKLVFRTIWHCLHRDVTKVAGEIARTFSNGKLQNGKKSLDEKEKEKQRAQKRNKRQIFAYEEKNLSCVSSTCLPKRSLIVLIDTFAGLPDFSRVVLLSLATLSMFVSSGSLTKGFLLCNAPKKEIF